MRRTRRVGGGPWPARISPRPPKELSSLSSISYGRCIEYRPSEFFTISIETGVNSWAFVVFLFRSGIATAKPHERCEIFIVDLVGCTLKLGNR